MLGKVLPAPARLPEHGGLKCCAPYASGHHELTLRTFTLSEETPCLAVKNLVAVGGRLHANSGWGVTLVFCLGHQGAGPVGPLSAEGVAFATDPLLLPGSWAPVKCRTQIRPVVPISCSFTTLQAHSLRRSPEP